MTRLVGQGGGDVLERVDGIASKLTTSNTGRHVGRTGALRHSSEARKWHFLCTTLACRARSVTWPHLSRYASKGWRCVGEGEAPAPVLVLRYG